MFRAIDNFYLLQEEPVKSCFIALREIILQQNENITTAWSYGMPFFYYRGKRFCYLWMHKKKSQPYLGIVDGKSVNHPDLIMEKRSRMKIMLFDPCEDLPIAAITFILRQAIMQYDG